MKTLINMDIPFYRRRELTNNNIDNTNFSGIETSLVISIIKNGNLKPNYNFLH